MLLTLWNFQLVYMCRYEYKISKIYFDKSILDCLFYQKLCFFIDSTSIWDILYTFKNHQKLIQTCVGFLGKIERKITKNQNENNKDKKQESDQQVEKRNILF